MNKNNLMSLVFFILSVSEASGQVNFGFQLDFGKNNLIGVLDSVSRFGHSQANSEIEANYFVSPSVTFRTKLFHNIYLDASLGYLPVKYDIKLNYFNHFFNQKVNSAFKIKLDYLKIPITLGYQLQYSDRSSVIFSAGLTTSYLVSSHDTYDDTIFESIFLRKEERYNKWLFSPLITVSNNRIIDRGKSYVIGLYLSKQAGPLIIKDAAWGFLANLHPSRNIQFGIQLKYLL